MKKITLFLFALCCAVISCSTSGGEKPFEPYLQIRPESLNFDANGGVADVQVLANFEYDIISSVDWLSAERDDSRDFWIKVTAATSKVTSKREGKITISGKLYDVSKDIVVSQEPFAATLKVGTSSISVSDKGATKSVTIESNILWSASCNANWVTITPTSGEKGSSTLNIKVGANTKTVTRNAVVKVFNNEYNIERQIAIAQEAHVKPINTSGWAEMPAMAENANWEYGFHDKLPSNNKLRNYSFCFDREKHCALWVAYPLHECYTDGGGKRTNAWSYDPCCIEDAYEPNLQNAYYPQGGSSYSHSRGHQLPSADRLASNEDNATTFYYTNMTPQLQSLNGDTWAKLEDELRNDYMCSDTLYVVTGAHFAPGYGYAYDNKGAGKACAVPTHYYKVILRTKKGNSGKWVGNCSASELQCVGFWFDHAAKAPRQTMSVAEIEKKTGHTFFPNVKNAPKSTYNPSEW